MQTMSTSLTVLRYCWHCPVWPR